MNSQTSPSPSTQVSPATTTTTLGSPCSPAWDEPWIETLNKREAELGHRICGARTPSGAPCELAPE
ncbi:MAG TPA: hypothetical protein PLI09_20050, partial [Candidatus Hydrogenedentes bacterium]|nr:hypothetical protein [Candidatus Hydrogenedentota bacterium]